MNYYEKKKLRKLISKKRYSYLSDTRIETFHPGKTREKLEEEFFTRTRKYSEEELLKFKKEYDLEYLVKSYIEKLYKEAQEKYGVKFRGKAIKVVKSDGSLFTYIRPLNHKKPSTCLSWGIKGLTKFKDLVDSGMYDVIAPKIDPYDGYEHLRSSNSYDEYYDYEEDSEARDLADYRESVNDGCE